MRRKPSSFLRFAPMIRTSLLLLLLLGGLSGSLLAQPSVDLSPTPKKGMNFYYELMTKMDCIGGDKGIAVFSAVVQEDGKLSEVKTVQSFHEKADSIAMAKIEKMLFFPGRSNHKIVATPITLAIRMELNPSFPMIMEHCDKGEGVDTYFKNISKSPTTYFFYPMMPAWEAEKSRHLEERRKSYTGIEEKKGNIKRINAQEDQKTVIVVKESISKPTQGKSSVIEGGIDDPDLGPLPVLEKYEPDPTGLSDPSPHAFIMLDKEPIPLNMKEYRLAAGYPRFPYLQELEGRVIMRLLVDENGQILKFIHLRDSISPFLMESGTAGIDVLKFTPGMANDKPTKCWISIPIDYRLIR